MTELKIGSIKDSGDIARERIIIPITEDCDIGGFVLLKTEANTSSLVAGSVSGYWFPNYDVKAGDLVVLYTKKGSYKTKQRSDGTTHFLYWGLISPIWADVNSGAALGVFSGWSSWRLGGFSEEVDVEPS